MHVRPRRRRKSKAVRDLVQESQFTPKDLIAPLFIVEGEKQRIPIPSMPGQFRLSLDQLKHECEALFLLGVPCVALFPAVDASLKTKDAAEAYNPQGLNQRAVRMLKKEFPSLLIMTDIALDPYSLHGQDGLVNPSTGEVLNDETLEILGKMAYVQAEAGSDILAPSDMMDGRVSHIRGILEENGYKNTLIMSYTAKYASGLYGPFRDALDSAPKKGDKKTYQINPANWREALLETELDQQEGADILMVKPGLAYLDVLSKMREKTSLPLAIYNVSGEYAMIKAACRNGWLDEEQVVMEILLSFKRAGADMILTYHAKDASQWLKR